MRIALLTLVASLTFAPGMTAAHAAGFKSRLTDTTLSNIPTTDALGNDRTSAGVIAAHATTYHPAPLPDQDYEAPRAQVAEGGASVSPDFFASRNHFQGDGFSHGSSLDGDRNNRIRPAGGMSLQIPMQ